MSRIVLTLAALGLILSGSVSAQPAPYPPPDQAPAQPGYPPPVQPGYAPPPSPGYPPPPGAVYAAPGVVPAVPPGTPYIGPDGVTYVNGAPVYFIGGVYQPLVFVAGFGWGYYGFGNRFFLAPGPLRARLDRFYPGGRGFPGHFEGGRDFHGRDFHDHGFR